MTKEKTPTPYQWRPHITAYFDEELREIKPRTLDDLHLTIDLFFDDPNLRGVPWDTSNGRSVVLPEEAIQYLKEGGVKLRAYKLKRES